MLDFTVVLTSVLTMVILMLPGWLFSKKKLVSDGFYNGLTQYVIMIAQPALIINSFLRDFDKQLLIDLGYIMLIVFAGYMLMFLISSLMFAKAPDMRRGVLRFLMMFTNAGFMGLPVLKSIFGQNGDTAVLYAVCAIAAHNILSWTIGVRMLTGKGVPGTWKKAVFNPGVISSVVGIILLLTSANSIMPQFVRDVVELFADTVTPLAMFAVGMKLAGFNLKSVLGDFRLWTAIGMRLLILPCLVFALFKLLVVLGVPVSGMQIAVPFIQLAMPCASMTSMMASQYGRDSEYASAGVCVSTILSVATVPVLSLLLNL